MATGDVRGTLTGSVASVTNPTDATGSVSVSVGDLIFGVFGQQTNLTATGTVTDNLGNTYQYVDAGLDVGTVSARAFYSIAANAGTLTTVHVPASASTNDASVTVTVFAGSFSAIDKTGAVHSDTASPFDCPSSGTLTQPYELVIGYIAIAGAQTPSVTSPCSLAGNLNRANASTALAACVTFATTAVAPQFTGTNATTGVGTATFKISGAVPYPGSALLAGAGGLAASATVLTTKVNFESIVNVTPGTGNNTGASPSITTPTTNPAVFVLVGLKDQNAVVNSLTITGFGGTASQVAAIRTANDGAGGYGYASLWKIVAPTPNTAGTVQANLSASVAYQMAVVTFSNADQTDPCPNADAATDASSTTPQTLTPTNVGASDKVLGLEISATLQNLNAVSPSSLYLDNTTNTNMGVGWGTTNATFGTDSAGVYAKIAVRVKQAVGATSWQGNALLAGAGALASSATLFEAANSLLAGAGALSASATLIETASALFAGASILTASSSLRVTASALLAGAVTITAPNAALLLPASSLFAGASTLAVSATLRAQSSALFAGASTLATSATYIAQPVTVLAGAAGASSPSAILYAAASFLGAGSSSLTVNASLGATQQQASALLAGSGSLTASAALRLIASALFSGTSSLTADVSKQYGSALLAGVGSLTSSASVITTGSALLAALGALTAAASLRLPASALLAGAAQLSSSSASVNMAASASAGVVGGLSAAAYVAKYGSALASVASSLSASSIQLLAGSALLVGSGSAAASTIYIANIQSTLAGVGGLLVSADYLAPQVESSVHVTPGTGTNTGPSPTITTPANGPFVLVYVAIASSTVDVTNLTITGIGGTASLLTSVLSNYAEQYARLSVWKITNPTPNASGTVQANLSGSAPYEMAVEVYSYANLTDPAPDVDVVTDNTSTTPATLTPANLSNSDRVSGAAASVTSVLNHVTPTERYYDALVPIELAVGDGRDQITVGLLDSGRQYAKAAVRVRALGPTVVYSGAVLPGAVSLNAQATVFHPSLPAAAALLAGAGQLSVMANAVFRASARLAGAGALSVDSSVLSKVKFGSSVSATPGTATSATSPSITTPANNPAVFVHIAITGPTAAVNSLTITGFGGTPVEVKTITATADGLTYRYSLWKITNPLPNTAGTVQANFSGSVPFNMVVETFSGVSQTDASPNVDAVSDNTGTTPQTLTPSNLTTLDATTGGAANAALQDLIAVSPNSRYLNNTGSANMAVGDNSGTTGITVGSDQGKNYAKAAARVKAASANFWQANATLAGAGGMSVDATYVFGGFWPAGAVLAGAGNLLSDAYPLTWVVGDSSLLVSAANLLMVASARFDGAGSVRADATTSSAIGPYTGAILNGSGGLAVQTWVRLTAYANIFPVTSGLTTSATLILPAGALLSGSSQLQVSTLLQGQVSASARLAGAGGLSASTVMLLAGAATLQGDSATRTTAALLAGADAKIDGEGAVGGVVTAQIAAASALLAGAGLFSGDASRARPVSALMGGIGSADASAALLASARATQAGSSGLYAVATQLMAGYALLAPAGALHASALSGAVVTDAAAFDAQGTLAVAARLRLMSSALLAGAGAVLARGNTVQPMASRLTGGLGLDVDTTQIHWISAESFHGTSQLLSTVVGQHQTPANATLAGEGAFSFSTIQVHAVTQTLSGESGQASTAQVWCSAFGVLSVQSNILLNQGSVYSLRTAQSNLSVLGGIAGAARLLVCASSKFSGAGSFDADIIVVRPANGHMDVESSFSVSASLLCRASALLGSDSALMVDTTQFMAAQCRMSGSGSLIPLQLMSYRTLELVMAGYGGVRARANVNALFGDTVWGGASGLRADAAVNSVEVASIDVTSQSEVSFEVGRPPSTEFVGKANIKRTHN